MTTMTVRPHGFHVDLRPTLDDHIPSRNSLLATIQSGAAVIIEHIERHKLLYRIGALTCIVLLAGDIASAADATGIDAGARKIYAKLISVGKWVIIIKGAFDTISSTVQGDFVAARKSGLSYMMVYVILLGLPWAFGQIETLFQDVT